MSGLGFNQRLLIGDAESPGQQDPDTGVWVPGTPGLPLYDGPADVQDPGTDWQRGREGMIVEGETHRAYLPINRHVETVLASLPRGGTCQATMPDGEVWTFTILQVRPMDAALALQRR
jgi:hypothetical protein